MSLYGCGLVWELDRSATEALQDAHECLWSQGVEHWKNSCLGFLLDSLFHGRWVQAGCSEALEVRGTFSPLSSCSSLGLGCVSVGLGAA